MKRLSVIIVVCVLTLLSAAASQAQPPDLTGSWRGTGTQIQPNGDLATFHYTLVVNNQYGRLVSGYLIRFDPAHPGIGGHTALFSMTGYTSGKTLSLNLGNIAIDGRVLTPPDASQALRLHGHSTEDTSTFAVTLNQD